jgi:hypothetical protein
MTTAARLETWQTGDRVRWYLADGGEVAGVVRLAGGFDTIGLPANDPRICAQARICEFGWLVSIVYDSRVSPAFYGVIDPVDAAGELRRPAVYGSRLEAEGVAAGFNVQQTGEVV